MAPTCSTRRRARRASRGRAGPLRRTIASTRAIDSGARVRSAGRKHSPTPYAPRCGQLEVDDRAQERVGHLDEDARAVAACWPRRPARRDGRGCTARRARSSTMSWLARPLMSTTNETPQASCSKRGSYRPSRSGRQLNGGREVVWSERGLAIVIVHPVAKNFPWAPRDVVGPAAGSSC